MSRIVFRPLGAWTDPVSEPVNTPFVAGWTDTCTLLRREADRLDVDEILLQVDASERDMRLDGGLRADARVRHHGVVVSFTCRHGPLRLACDTFVTPSWRQMPSWQANVRAIALGLEALRKVDRYGIAARGEQYTGWAQLNPGSPHLVDTVTRDEAIAILGEWLVPTDSPVGWSTDRARIDELYRRGAKQLHPDAGGDPTRFRRLAMARNLLANWR